MFLSLMWGRGGNEQILMKCFIIRNKIWTELLLGILYSKCLMSCLVLSGLVPKYFQLLLVYWSLFGWYSCYYVSSTFSDSIWSVDSITGMSSFRQMLNLWHPDNFGQQWERSSKNKIMMLLQERKNANKIGWFRKLKVLVKRKGKRKLVRSQI